MSSVNLEIVLIALLANQAGTLSTAVLAEATSVTPGEVLAALEEARHARRVAYDVRTDLWTACKRGDAL